MENDPSAPTSLSLNEVPRAILIEAGEALFFRVRTEPDGSPGPRRYLLTLSPGAVCVHPGEPGVLLVPGPGCRLREIPLESVSIPALETWIARLTALFSEELPPAMPRIVGENGDQGQVGDILSLAPDEMAWIRVQEGLLHPLGSASNPLNAASPAFPMTESLWLQVAEAPLQVTLARSSDLTENERLAGLRSLVSLVLSWDQQAETRELELNQWRAQRRQDDLQRETAQAVGRLVQLIESQPLEIQPGEDLPTALAVLGRELGITFRPAPEVVVGDPVEAIARTSRVRFRRLHLSGEWWKEDLGPILAFRIEGEGEAAQVYPIALVRRSGSYEAIDVHTRQSVVLSREVAAFILARAYQFFPPFPQRTLSLWELPSLALRSHVQELFAIGIFTLVATLLGLVLPMVTSRVVDTAIPQGDQSLLLQFGLLLIAVYAGQSLFSLAQGYIGQRFYTGSTMLLQAGTWDRLLHLGLGFFQKFSSGDLLKRAMLVTEVSQQINSTMLRSLLSGTLSLFYLLMLFSYSSTLAWVALALALVTTAITVVLAMLIRREALPLTLIEGKNFGFVVQLINGVAKLRVAGAEQRGFNRWARRYEQELRHTARIRFLEDLDHVILFVLPLLGSLVLYTLAVPLMANPAAATALTLGGLVAFFTTYGMFTEGLNAVGTTIVDVTDILARQVLLKPILETEPETLRNKTEPGILLGHVAVEDVSFRYTPTGPMVLSNVSIEAHPGEFIAIVGPSGSGKSTLVRLMLGFEPPASGQILYDGKNLGGLDLQSVRKQMGTVLQSSYLFAGPLYENIAAGNLVDLDTILEAVKQAGLEEDVRGLPMGLHTLIPEGGRSLSGGQRQRILLARALVTDPRILILDEATSALDNRTQAVVTENLARRRVTRIVIAHRLSTIQQADRIYVLDQGIVVQMGSFAELMAQDGLFRRLMERQQT